METSVLWTAKEAARYLKVSTKSLYEIARIPRKKGGPPTITFFKVTKRHRKENVRPRPLIRFDRDDFIAWSKKGMTRCSA